LRQARERWITAGKPPNPGRLNDLRHIVYKPADAPWRRARICRPATLPNGAAADGRQGPRVEPAALPVPPLSRRPQALSGRAGDRAERCL
jgi:hypothetical protein